MVASACCWLPLVLLSAGLSGAAAAAALETYRPLVMTLALVFLGAAFYATARQKTSLWAIAILVVAGLLLPYYIGRLLGTGAEGQATVASNVCCPAPQREILAESEPVPHRGAFDHEVPAMVVGNQSSPSPKGGSQSEFKIDSARELVINVEGLTCFAVKGLGCGSLIRPVLAQVEAIPGTEASWTNRTGTMLRISLAPTADRHQVIERLGEILNQQQTESSASEHSRGTRLGEPLTGRELRQSLAGETRHSPDELSAIEFRALVRNAVQAFAATEALDEQTAASLLEIARREWERLEGEAQTGKRNRPIDWLGLVKEFATHLPPLARPLLTTAQMERLIQQAQQPF
jgi:hypothetical protein